MSEMASIDAVVFDLDDTLIDWWGSISRCLAELTTPDVADALLDRCRQDHWHLDPTESFIWHRNTWAMHEYRHEFWPLALPAMDADERDRLIADFAERLHVEMFDDTAAALDKLGATHRLAILSNNHLLNDEVIRLRLDRWFDIALFASAPTHKPHPNAFGPVIAALGVAPERCLYVGDSVKADVHGALNAGMIPVWVDRWNDPWTERPPTVQRITTLGELPQLVHDLRS
jgi:HAD superfamily hydrolase (TIGR01549 family)